jgi:hypothetical protein
MTAAPSLLEANSASPSDAQPVPIAMAYVTVTRHEHIRLVQEARSWKSLHQRAIERAQWRDQRYRRVEPHRLSRRPVGLSQIRVI